jgi:DNA repair photolyase
MRWEHLTAGDALLAPPLPLALPGAVVRTFDTPGFAGMTFYEVRAKSIINRVPHSSYLPFEWTINPYRGCSHACAYCLSGDTPILMADNRTRPLADLRVSDRIYGTVREGGHRRYVATEVLAHWSTVKPAYRVTLADGTRLVASGDHRFLTNHGWKHVAGPKSGSGGRPNLTTGDRLMGIGRFAAPPTALRRFAFEYSVESGGPPHGMITRERTIDDTAVKSDTRLGVVSIEPLGFDLPMYDITTGTGDFIANGVVSHNCFARNTHTYLDLDAGEDFDRRVIVKVNAGERLRRELAAPAWRGDPIAMGTNVDCYQRAEGRYQLMREILSGLRDFANPFSILTKGTLMLRDLDLLRQAATVTDVRLAVSVGFVDEALWRSVEPGTPSPRRRLDMVRQLSDAGFPVAVLMAPILPGLTDGDASIEATVAAIAAAGAASLVPLVLHLRPGAREWYGQWLAREYPALAPRYRELYARGSYAPKHYQRGVAARVRIAARRHGLDRPAHPDADRSHRQQSQQSQQSDAPATEQPTLW